MQASSTVRLVSSDRTAYERNLDWFRYWLQGYEDPNPAKAEQYKHWEAMCDAQKTNRPDSPASCVGTKPKRQPLCADLLRTVELHHDSVTSQQRKNRYPIFRDAPLIV